MVIHSRPRSLWAIGLLCAALLTNPIKVQAQQADFSLFTGTVRLACEALLCLSSSVGSATAACNPALSYYYGINEKYLSDTIAARLNFLQQCPTASHSPQMAALADAISKGAGRCDAASLNRALGRWYTDGSGRGWVRTSEKKPSYCSARSEK